MGSALHWLEIARLRRMPLNHVAALKLRMAGVVERDGMLPVFLLMEWGLSVGIRPLQCRTARELFRLGKQADQLAALEYLLASVPGGRTALTRRLLHLPPKTVALELLDLLDLRLKADPRMPCPIHPEG